MENVYRTEEYGRERHVDAPEEHHLAFEHVIAYAVAGEKRKVVASMREHWCRRLIDLRGAGTMSLEEAVILCEEVCYGPLTIEIASMVVRERCNNDAPREIDQALRLLGGSGVW